MTAPTERLARATKSTFWHQALVSGHASRAGQGSNPAYLRLADLAVALAGPNGHAEFGPGELVRFLGVADYRAVDSAITMAKRYGLLGKGSNKRCLQLPDAVMLPYAPGQGREERDAKRQQPCGTCHGKVADPARCHPDRERYTSVGKGGLCEPCYRRDLKADKAADADADWESLVQNEPTAY